MFFALFIVCSTALCPVSEAVATVHFGNGVRVGGHDFSNQTFDSKHRAKIYLYDRTPKHEGCAWHSDGHGGQVKVCHLRSIKPRH
jgi:hypothetical protein